MTVTTTACADTQAPTAPTNLVVGTRTATSIALSWSPSTDNVGVVSYGLYRGGVSVGTTSGTTGIVTGLTCGTNYTLGVDAADAAGNYSPQTVVMVATTACADTQPPTAPTALVVSGVTQTALTVGWTASTGTTLASRDTRVDRDGTVVAQPTSTSANLSGLACGTTYTVGVLARDTAGNVSARTAAQATTSACSTTPPPSGAQVFVSPSGNDAAACSQVAPCRSFDRAYRVAQPGQTVEVACGSYGAQSVGRDASKTSSSDVVFRPANSAAPCVRILGPLSLGDTFTQGPNHISFVGTAASRWLLKDSSNLEHELGMGNLDDVTLVEFDAANFFMNRRRTSRFVVVILGRARCRRRPVRTTSWMVRRGGR